MPDDFSVRTLRHLNVSGRTASERFTRPGVPVVPRRVVRLRDPHAQHLLRELDAARTTTVTGVVAPSAVALAVDEGLLLEFESHPDFSLKLDSMDARRSGFHLLNVRTREVRLADGSMATVELATVKVSRGALGKLVQKITDFRDTLTRTGQWRHRDLVLPLEHIRRATLDALWNEEPENPLPAAGVVASWEAWLHTGERHDERTAVEDRFMTAAQAVGIEVFAARVELPEATVRLIRATREQIASSWALLDCLVELRAPAITADFFIGLPAQEQRTWSEELLHRLQPPGVGANAVCLLDSGINEGHPLLRPLVPADGLATYATHWGTHDGISGNGHGTLMAGIAAYGDLRGALTSQLPIVVGHHIESVKVLAPDAATRNEETLWPDITSEGVARIETAAPGRRRVFALQVTAVKTAARGRPTTWSAVVDQLSAGVDDPGRAQRLICVSAGNTSPLSAADYPSENDTAQVHDPAQAWNAITVGGMTELVRLDPSSPVAARPLAPHGGLAPSSTTSLTWHPDWPLKPDIVCEAGNRAVLADGSLDAPESLALLSTSANHTIRHYAATADTSAASVQAARLAAILQQEYPDYWPETLRALIIHSAEWTESMRERRSLVAMSKSEVLVLLRRFGFGSPDQARALRCARNALTLVVQDSLQPYRQVSSHSVVTNEMNVHHLPWPGQQLRDLGEAEVRLRVTLSYFVEPNPGPRSTNNRYRYASTNLRFDLRRPTESLQEFRARINTQARAEDVLAGAPTDSARWRVGADGRHRGSLHSDIWSGPAAELAEKGHLAVYPVGGWWKLRPKQGKANERMRYALVVSIEAPEVPINLYEAVANQLTVPVTVRAGR